ncbi:hypothetical protein ACFL1G_11790 [Planctomycetota bacterium]
MSKSKIDEKTIKEALERAVQEIRDYDGEDYIGNRPLFICAQHMQGVISKETPFDKVEPWFEKFFESADGLLVDEDEDPISYYQALALFREVWPKVKFPKGEAFEVALDRASQYKTVRPEISWCDDKGIQLLVHTTYELTQMRGDDLFFLSGYDAGRILGKSQGTGRAVLMMLVDMGMYKVVKPGSFPNIATLYRYIGRPNINSKRLNPEQFEQ